MYVCHTEILNVMVLQPRKRYPKVSTVVTVYSFQFLLADSLSVCLLVLTDPVHDVLMSPEATIQPQAIQGGNHFWMSSSTLFYFFLFHQTEKKLNIILHGYDQVNSE